ncbi:MAG TPA: hemerythrin domain-containing protein [Epulopiscium sp.]|nr:hemerythrin domain-containing protein [Candidatus Epulonipiscium sp.]
MDCIELMVEEHKAAKRMLKVIRRYCYKILKNEEIEYQDFFIIIDFLRTFVDHHHHGKEEKLLFNQMRNKLGPIGEKLITHGMLVEHDLGRLHIQELEAAVNRVIEGDEESKLDLIANAISYCHLLDRHIDKEDAVVYKYATNNLDQETLDQINRECEDFEQSAEKQKIQLKYLNILEEMEL